MEGEYLKTQAFVYVPASGFLVGVEVITVGKKAVCFVSQASSLLHLNVPFKNNKA